MNQELVDRFLAEHPECLNPNEICGKCHIVSQQFARFLTTQGASPKMLFLMDYLGTPFEKIHPMWTETEFLVHCVVLVDETTYDFTHRQFDPGSHVPVVRPVANIHQDWDTVEEQNDNEGN